MKQFIIGVLFESMVTGTIVGDGSFYDSNGQPAAAATTRHQAHAETAGLA